MGWLCPGPATISSNSFVVSDWSQGCLWFWVACLYCTWTGFCGDGTCDLNSISTRLLITGPSSPDMSGACAPSFRFTLFRCAEGQAQLPESHCIVFCCDWCTLEICIEFSLLGETWKNETWEAVSSHKLGNYKKQNRSWVQCNGRMCFSFWIAAGGVICGQNQSVPEPQRIRSFPDLRGCLPCLHEGAC
jgi:hypothetical protein